MKLKTTDEHIVELRVQQSGNKMDINEGIPQIIHTSKLRDPHYNNIKEELKIYEMRVNDEKRQAMEEGHIWIFVHDSKKDLDPIKTKIVERKLFDTFRQAINETGVDRLLPGVSDVEEGIKIYESFPHKEGTYKEGATKFGVVRFKLELF